MNRYVVLIACLYFNSLNAQVIFEEKILDEKSGITFIEIDRIYKEVITIKDVFVVLSCNNDNQSNKINAVKNSVLKNDIKNAVFYFAMYNSNLPDLEKTEIFKSLVLSVLDRKMMLEANLYVITPEDITNKYNEYYNDYKNVEGSYSNPIRDTLLDTNINQIIDFILVKHRLPPDYYDKIKQ